MEALKRAWKAAQEAYRRARSRWYGARKALREIRPELAQVNNRLGLMGNNERGNGRVRDELEPGPAGAAKLEVLDERGRILERKKSLEDQVERRKEIKQREHDKLDAAREAYEKSKESGQQVAPGVVIAARAWNPNKRPCAEGFVAIIDRAWDRGWRGILNSGWRSPEYSESICIGMCGQTTCPGRCAGRGSRHSQTPWQAGAIDVSDPWKFDSVTPELFNALGSADPWHMSTTGR